MKKLYLYAILSIFIIPKDANAGWVSKIVQEVIDYASSVFNKLPTQNFHNIDKTSPILDLKDLDLNISISESIFLSRGSNVIIKNKLKNEENEENEEKDGLLIDIEKNKIKTNQYLIDPAEKDINTNIFETFNKKSK